MVAEAKWSDTPFTLQDCRGLAQQLLAKRLPNVKGTFKRVERALLVPKVKGQAPEKIEGVWLVVGRDVFWGNSG